MEEEKIYIIEDFGGEYSDSWQHIFGIFSNKEKAIDVAETHWKYKGDIDNNIKIPYKVYVDYLDVFYDENVDEYNFKDLLDYSKKDWEETHEIISTSDGTYLYTQVSEFNLNQIFPETNKKTIWIKYNKHLVHNYDPDAD
jgi:hypothetical protein